MWAPARAAGVRQNTKTGTAGSTTATDAKNRAFAVIDQIVAPTTSNGFSLPNSPARVFPIGFGDLFDNPGATRTSALNFLQEVAFRGKTSASAADPLPSYQVISGTADARIQSIRDAFERIMQSGVQVTLVK
jgi:hypothetical protein